MPLNISFAVIPMICLSCSINSGVILPTSNETQNPSFIENTMKTMQLMATTEQNINELVEKLTETAGPSASPDKLNAKYLPPPGPLRTLADVSRSDDSPRQFTQLLSPGFIPIPIAFRQEGSNAQGIMSTITSMLAGMMPFAHRPHPVPASASAPHDVPVTHKHHEEEKTETHEHVSDSDETLPVGVLPGGVFYEGQKANGEYFNEEMPASETLEVHSHDEVSSPGKLYDEKSEHPYYIVDKPAEGPAPPPLVYFTNGLRSDDTSATAAAWDNYYAKLKEYNENYNNYYKTNGRSVDGGKNQNEEIAN